MVKITIRHSLQITCRSSEELLCMQSNLAKVSLVKEATFFAALLVAHVLHKLNMSLLSA